MIKSSENLFKDSRCVFFEKRAVVQLMKIKLAASHVYFNKDGRVLYVKGYVPREQPEMRKLGMRISDGVKDMREAWDFDR